MMRMTLAAAVALALSACDRKVDPPIRASASAEPVTALSRIAGRWEIVRFGGFTPSWKGGEGWRSHYVQIGDDGLDYSIGCNHSGNRATIDEGGHLVDLTDGRRISTLMGCGAERELRDQEFYAFFATRPKVTRTSDGRILLDNGQVQLDLERPEAARLRLAPKLDEIAGRWVPQSYEDFSGHGSSGGSFDSAPGVLTIGRDALEWSECREATVRTRYSPQFRFEQLAAPQGDCKRGEQPGGDGAVQLMRLMRGNPAVQREGFDRIVLFSDSEAIHLQSEQTVLHPPPPPPVPPGVSNSPPPPPPPR